GGPTPDLRNVISGNKGQGIYILDAGTSGNRILGNFIGTNAAGNAALPNAVDGVRINAPNNVVGAPGAGDVISGNTRSGVGLYGAAVGILVQGNYIGTDAAGALALGNGDYGVGALGTSSITIGGLLPGAGNVISGNRLSGIAGFPGSVLVA